jgi:cyclic beta-1,2-glucan synthetase
LLSEFFTFLIPSRGSKFMERVQLERRSAGRIRPPTDPILGLTSQEVRLTNGRYSVSLTAVGGGVSECRGLDVSRWTPDPTCDSDGFHIYLRDLDDEFVWSASYQPTRVTPDAYQFQFTSSLAEINRLDREIECRLSVCVAPEQDFELRRCRLVNRGNRSRRIELTSYVEFVLSSREADANHPTFLKLFIETEFRPRERVILARRRPRSSKEPEQFGFHRLLANSDTAAGGAQFETNRKRFIGRGRNAARPRALDPGAKLIGEEGPVLDPIGSLRTTVSLAPGEARDFIFQLGAAQGREAIEALVAAIDDLDGANAIFAGVEAAQVHGNGEATQWITHPAHDRLASRLREAESHRVYLPASDVVTETERPPQHAQEKLHFENSFGGFSADGREYVIRLEPDGQGRLRLPPQPWVNVIANERAGCIVTERGAGYTWAGNSRHNRITAYHNDSVCDPHAEALWLRDEEADVFWSPLPGPTPADAPYEVRHGFGSTMFRHASLGLVQETTVFMAPDEPVKLVRLRIENPGQAPRKLTLFTFQHWLLGTLVGESELVATEYDASLQAILARNPQRDLYRDAVAFSTVVSDAAPESVSHTADRASFLGRNGDQSTPAAVAESERLDGRTGGGLDPCAAWQLPLEIPPGKTIECTLVLGEAADRGAAAKLVRKYRTAGQVQQAFDQSAAFWREMLSAIQIETPDRAIDLMVNGWLLYQNLSCRMWGRSAYYQPGGAFGFRDQLQDSAALIYHRPDITRRQILRHAGQQFVEGDVLHWWHEDTGFGLRTRFSDDLVWLPLVTASYVATTGDEALLEQLAPFIDGAQLKPGQAELGMISTPAGSSGTIYEHCCRALDRALTTGPHELPLIGSGDWNDGMNRVGQGGKGESVWLGFFLHAVLGQMIPLCTRRHDSQRAARYTAERERLANVLNGVGWDGGWYRRAFYDNGQPIGSATSDECQIDALAQAWAVLSGVAPRERADLALDAVDERLVDDEAGLIRLLAPPFDQTPQDPGYIKGYVPGVRENGGQYTHGVLFFVRAVAEMGRGTRAVELLKMLSPVTRTATAEQTAIYQTEPYVVAADVYSEPPHVGRGGWTWYTGSAGWMFRVAVESIFGLSIDGGRTLVLRPAISSTWPSCRLNYRLPDGQTRYEITIENPAGKETGVTAATLDGERASVVDGAARIELKQDGKLHRVVALL